MNEINSALIGAIATLSGTFVAYVALKAAYRRSLDLESKWREFLFKAASAEKITMQEVHILRTALRYKEKTNPIENSFDWLSKKIIEFCNHLNLKYYTISNNTEKTTELTYGEQEVVRIFIRCVLKHHWEVNQIGFCKMINLFIQKIMNKNKINNKEIEYVRETLQQAKRVYDYRPSISTDKKFDFS